MFFEANDASPTTGAILPVMVLTGGSKATKA